uniref:Uncharacterized protein n=1 Tax=Strombidium rassoulzadegani TaxID=1082188 RepID=A0A7S3FY01_9SPIT|mmetsp:Transcript_9392/g.15836  ORF Transcript_9392/g.15836 Transcript_9392/m.15836 type:complete len:114 (+) Transcript_9392:260-601(+)
MSPLYYDKRDAEGAVGHLVNESVVRWQREQGMVDDITIIVAYLNQGRLPPSNKAQIVAAASSTKKISQMSALKESQNKNSSESQMPVSPPSGATDLNAVRMSRLNDSDPSMQP